MDPIEQYLKNFLRRAYPKPLSNIIAQRYAPHNNASGMHYNTSPLPQVLYNDV